MHWGLGDSSGGNNPNAIGDTNYVYPSSMQINQSVNLGTAVANNTGSAVAGSVASGLSLAAGIVTPACPPCGAALAIGAQLVAPLTHMLEGCGQSCIQASDYANQIEPLLQQNLANYTNTPRGQRTASLQANSLANFTTSFNNLIAACQNIGGQGGQNCIKDRQIGGCKWKATPWAWNSDGTFTPAGASGSGSSCWNWVYGYHDPIANDPYVVPDPVSSIAGSVGAGLSALASGSTAGIPNEFLLLGALVLVIVAVSQ